MKTIDLTDAVLEQAIINILEMRDDAGRRLNVLPRRLLVNEEVKKICDRLGLSAQELFEKMYPAGF